MDGQAYVKGMHMSNSEGAPTPGSSDQGVNPAYFEGVAAAYDAQGNRIDENTKPGEGANGPQVAYWELSGVFSNFSDATKDSVFSKGTVFNNNSRLDTGSYHQDLGYISGSIRIFEYEEEVDGEMVKRLGFRADNGSASAVKWTTDHTKFVQNFDENGVTSISQITSYKAGEIVSEKDFQGRYAGHEVTKFSYQIIEFDTKKVGEYNVPVIGKDGYVVKDARDENGNRIQVVDAAGEKVFDENGNPVYQKDVSMFLELEKTGETDSDGVRIDIITSIKSGSFNGYKTENNSKIEVYDNGTLMNGGYDQAMASDGNVIIYIEKYNSLYAGAERQTDGKYVGEEGEEWSVADSQQDSSRHSLQVTYGDNHMEYLDGRVYLNGGEVMDGIAVSGTVNTDNNKRSTISDLDTGEYTLVTQKDGVRTVYEATKSEYLGYRRTY